MLLVVKCINVTKSFGLLILFDSAMKVSWNLDTLGDFVIMRSNGRPVYNFCVTVDDASMAISHVIRLDASLCNSTTMRIFMINLSAVCLFTNLSFLFHVLNFIAEQKSIYPIL